MSNSAQRLFNVPDTALYLGVSQRHVRRMANERRIAVVKERKLIRFDVRDLDAWIEAHRRPVA